MKSFKLYFATLTVILTFAALSSTANNNYPLLLEEVYINDIPFDTELIAEIHSFNGMVKEFDFSEETEIFDIPFNTACIIADCRYEMALAREFEMEEETYINDIPFNTEKINAIPVSIDFSEESDINDIPFDTYSVVKKLENPAYAFNK